MQKRKLIILTALFAFALSACGGAAAPVTTPPNAPPTGPGDPIAGAEIYRATCSACHGSDLEGVNHIGLPLTPSDFVKSLSEQELADYTEKGRTVDDPANVMGRSMPPKGGNPSLTSQDLLDVAAYLKAQN